MKRCHVPKILYKAIKLRPETLEIVRRVNRIVDDYTAQGLVLTVRQIFYRFVAGDLFPDSWADEEYNSRHGQPEGTKNTEKNYKRLGGIINDGRLAGLIDWEAIEDRTRSIRRNSHWESPGEIVATCAVSFAIDKWARQEHRPEVFIEKEALAGVIAGICEELDVTYFACRGYVSQSEMWVASQRLHDYREAGQTPVIFYLGDHDPSGIDMTRDVDDRLAMFLYAEGFDVRRLALNMDQVREYRPPPNPARVTDSRSRGYISRFGNSSWELDALEPSVLRDLIRDNVLSLRDETLWEEAVADENRHRRLLRRAANCWDDVARYLERRNPLSGEEEDE